MIKAVKFRLLNALFYFCRPLCANPLNVKFLTWQLRDLGFCRWNRNRVFPIIHPPIPLSAAGSAGPPCRGAGCTRSAGAYKDHQGQGAHHQAQLSPALPAHGEHGDGLVHPELEGHVEQRNSRSNWTHWNSWTDRLIWSAGGEGQGRVGDQGYQGERGEKGRRGVP